jgi:archaellum biogenesis protein FlaJ (TadC family)
METVLVAVGVPLIVFSTITAIILVPVFLHFHYRKQMLDTVRLAVKEGGDLPPELVTALSQDAPWKKTPPPTPEQDLRRGALSIAIALATCVFAAVISSGDTDWGTHPLFGLAAFPAFVGLAWLAFGIIGLKRRRI